MRCVIFIVNTDKEAEAVVEKIIWYLEQGKCSKYECFQIQLAAEAAIANAIVHGNKKDPNKLVAIRFYEDGPKVFIEVEDEGEGFDTESPPEPAAGRDLLQFEGYGIILMKEIMDDVRFLREGRCVILEKHCSRYGRPNTVAPQDDIYAA